MKNNYHRLFIYSTTLLLVVLNIPAIPIIFDLPAMAVAETAKEKAKAEKEKIKAEKLKEEEAAGVKLKEETKLRDEETAAAAKLKEEAKLNAANSRMIGQILNGLAIFLHIVEVAGLVILFLTLKKSNEQKDDRIDELNEKISSLKEEHKTKNNVPVFNKSESVPAHLTYRLDEMARQITALQNRSGSSSQQQPYSSQPPRSLPPAPPAMRLSGYAFLDLYKQNPEACKSQYSAIRVSENEENIQKRWDGQQQDIILEETRRGNYWLIDERETTYLVPIPNLRITETNMGTVGELFNCENYTANYSSVNIIKPAVVKAQPGINRRWKPYEKGLLAFT